MSVNEMSKIQTDSVLAKLSNGGMLQLDEIPDLSIEEFGQAILTNVAFGQRVSALFASPVEGSSATHLYVVLADDEDNELSVGRVEIKGNQFPSLTQHCPQVHMFEREIAEQYGLKPVDHPWLKPVRSHRSFTNRDLWYDKSIKEILPATGEFYSVDGEQIHEVAVGPVHAGIIEPGHFRFQCHGEEVFHLEIALGYQHRGIEKAFMSGPAARILHYAENIAGDSAIAHGSTYCQNIEALCGIQNISPRALAIRGIALELERLANHVGDLGALAMDIGFLPTSSYCGRIRGDFLNMTAVICGNRFGRGLVRPGGVRFDIEKSRVDDLLKRLKAAERDVNVAINLLWDTQSVLARFEKTGALTAKNVIDLGLVGPAARAAGVIRDVRQDHSSGIYCFAHIPVSNCNTGDVFARAYVRWLEIQQSLKFVIEQVRALPNGSICVPYGDLTPNSIAISLNEGWRGEVCHVALTNESGRFIRYKVVDPSFHNWMGLAMALRDQQISDFPICNKSFNLSYCGHDL
ncbi:MAG TPA: NADH-quinone oxidoreductase subunit C [Chitinispirillaceae bacterium]|nr:NADH-quinone oxidoreductase subunit C [Chitinispirillaceae bacterium]